MKELFNINPKLSTALSVVIGYILMDDLTANEQNTLGNLLMLTAQTLITNASSQALIETRISGKSININSKKAKEKYNPPIYDIEYIRKIINELNPNLFSNNLDILNKKIREIEKFLNSL